MAVKDIIEKIRTDRDMAVQKIKEEALSSSREKEREGERKASILEEEFMKKAKEDASRKKEKIIVEAQVQVRKDILSFKQDFLKEAFRKAEEKIKESDRLYQEFLEKVLSRFSQGEEEVIFSPFKKEKFSLSWLKDFNKKNKLNLKFSRERAKNSGGVIIRDGKKEINGSLKALIRQIQENYQAEIAKILFEEL